MAALEVMVMGDLGGVLCDGVVGVCGGAGGVCDGVDGACGGAGGDDSSLALVLNTKTEMEFLEYPLPRRRSRK